MVQDTAADLFAELFGDGTNPQPIDLDASLRPYLTPLDEDLEGLRESKDLSPAFEAFDRVAEDFGDDSGASAAGMASSPADGARSAPSNYTRDAAGRITSVIDANAHLTSFSYDAAGNLISLIDPDSNTTAWTYGTGESGEERVESETNELGSIRYYGYDESGNLARYTDGNGQVREYGYDSGGNVASETWYPTAEDAENAENAEDTIVYQRDSAGRITSETDNVSSLSYVYNDGGEITSTTESSVDGPTTVLTYQYDTAGNRSEMAATIDGTADFVDDYVYDSLGRVVSVVEHGVSGGNAVAEKEIDIAYNEDGTISSIDRYDDSVLVVEGDYSYDEYGRLVGLVYHQGDTVLNSYAWTYSSSGQSAVGSGQSGLSTLDPQLWMPSGGLMPIHDTSGVVEAILEGGFSGLALVTSMTSNDGTASYSYDPTGQLLAVTYFSPNPEIPESQNPESYSYDANGNRTNTGYVIGADNQLLSDGTYTYAYDAEGNRTAKFSDVDQSGTLTTGDTEITEYTWDSRNRLTEIRDYATFAALSGNSPTQVVDYLYDVENRWIGENIDFDGDGVVDHQIRFAYDGNQIVLQFDKAGTGDVTGTDLSHRYLWQPQAVDQLMADEQLLPASGGGYDQSQPGNVVLPLADQLGTIRDLTTNDAQTGVTSVANHRVYDSFGNLLSQTSAAVDCLFGFTGRPLDKATGLQNNLERWYDAKAGGWMSKDPIGLTAADTNASRYCGNCPLMFSDPVGLQVWLFIYCNEARPGENPTGGHAALLLIDTVKMTITTYSAWPDRHPDIQKAGLSNGRGSDVRKNFSGDFVGHGETYHYRYGVKLTNAQVKVLEKEMAKDWQWSELNNFPSLRQPSSRL